MTSLKKGHATLAALAAAGTMIAAPAIAPAKMRHDTSKGKGNRPSGAKGAPSAVRLVAGTLVSVTPDNPATAASEATVTLKLTAANRHARRSGDIVDRTP